MLAGRRGPPKGPGENGYGALRGTERAESCGKPVTQARADEGRGTGYADLRRRGGLGNRIRNGSPPGAVSTQLAVRGRIPPQASGVTAIRSRCRACSPRAVRPPTCEPLRSWLNPVGPGHKAVPRPRGGLTTDRLVEAAAELVDENGFENVGPARSPTGCSAPTASPSPASPMPSACCEARFTATACWNRRRLRRSAGRAAIVGQRGRRAAHGTHPLVSGDRARGVASHQERGGAVALRLRVSWYVGVRPPTRRPSPISSRASSAAPRARR